MQNREAKLVPIRTVSSRLLYAEWGLAGALSAPFAAHGTVQRLEKATAYLQERSTSRQEFGLLIWDAYRTVQTQKALFDGYVRQLIAEASLNYETACEQASEFVCPPTAVFPHGTGGAVDVTLQMNGEEAPMGTGFDDFVPQAGSDWYRDHPPDTDAECLAAANREQLRSAMEAAGFVGLSSEWWHFEWGTRRWATSVGQAIVLHDILPTPTSMLTV